MNDLPGPAASAQLPCQAASIHTIKDLHVLTCRERSVLMMVVVVIDIDRRGKFIIVFLSLFAPTAGKVQEEIQRVLGAERLPTYEDRKRMHYSHAVIHEVQRFISLLPQMPRAAAVDTVFHGYFIPKVQSVPFLSLVRRFQA